MTAKLARTAKALLWRHHESAPHLVGPAALQTAKTQSWHQLDPVSLARNLRAFLVLSLQGAILTAEPQASLGDLSASGFSTNERNAIGSTVARTLLYLVIKPIFVGFRDPLETTEGMPLGSPSRDVGTMPTVAVVTVTTPCALTAALAAARASEVADSAHFRSTPIQRLLADHAVALQTIAKHCQRETAGLLIPYSDAELDIIKTVERQQRDFIAKHNLPLPSPFEGSRHFAEDGASNESTGGGAGLAAAALAAVAWGLT